MNATPNYVAPRTCTIVDGGEANRGANSRTAPLSHYADCAAYVLIGEPGAGKTTTFRTEAARQGATYVTVRNFRTFDDKPEWHGKTLFLDGLDESRAGTQDGRTPLDDIRNKLNRLGCPRFRLSCRWADWMAANDKDALKEVSPDGTVTVIRLDPLSKEDIKTILTNEAWRGRPRRLRCRGEEARGAPAANESPEPRPDGQGRLRGGMAGLPEGRRSNSPARCSSASRTESTWRRTRRSADKGPLIEAAGRLCAAQLLSGVAGYTLRDRAEPDADFPFLHRTSPATRPRSATRNVLGTRLFEGTSEGKLAPAHRQIAEFLAARHVSALIDDGESSTTAGSGPDYRFRRRTGAVVRHLRVLAGGAQQALPEETRPAGRQRADLRGRPTDLFGRREARPGAKPSPGVVP